MASQRWNLIDRAVSIIVAIAALVVAGAALVQSRTPAQAGGIPALTAERAEAWEEILAHGRTIRSGGAIVVAQFGDFECPFCKRFAEALRALPDSTRSLVTEVFINFPLSIHPQAFPSALALECAPTGARSAAVHDRLFERQDSVSRFGPDVVLEAGGLSSNESHNACIRSEETRAKVESAVALGRRLGVVATPTVYVNGLRLNRAPNPRELDSLIHAVRRAR